MRSNLPMLYEIREAQRAFLNPLLIWAHATAKTFGDPASPLSLLPGAQRLAAGSELFYRLGKEYKKPEFGIKSVQAKGRELSIVETPVLEKPFCRLLHFKRYADDPETVRQMRNDPVILLCAPMAGHHATLLRDTARSMLVDHEVYITDWTDARMVPLGQGEFHLHDYVTYILEFIRHLGTDNLHVVAVCQSTVPVLGAISLLASKGEKTPRGMVLMGGPIDTRRSPTAVNSLATTHPFEWFEDNVIYPVPSKYPGAGRRVYPGFLQHLGFVAMNADRHVRSHWEFYQSLVHGDKDDAQAHMEFYDEYNAVLDMDADYYLETVKAVFQEFHLPRGLWQVKGQLVRPQDITNCSLLTIEGELDDISGCGQTQAAHDLCTSVPVNRKQHYEAPRSGHYGIFSGGRWRETIYPILRDFIQSAQEGRTVSPYPTVRVTRPKVAKNGHSNGIGPAKSATAASSGR